MTQTLNQIELSDLLRQQRNCIDYFFENFDSGSCRETLEEIATCKGTLFLSGVGKSALVGKKIAATLLSTGTKALYLSPTHALHGDLGIVEPGDLFFLLSKSGESEELLSLLPFLKERGATSWAITCSRSNRLAASCDRAVCLPMQRELCPFNLAPTTSATIMTLFGDLLCVALMQMKGFSMEAYAANHPAGRLGKRLTLRVADLMVSGDALPLCAPEEHLKDLMERFSSKNCGCLLVVDEAMELIGLFTDGDLRRSLERYGETLFERKIGELMTPSPRTVLSDCLAWEALQMMEENPARAITLLPVLEASQKLVGLFRMHDALQAGI